MISKLNEILYCNNIVQNVRYNDHNIILNITQPGINYTKGDAISLEISHKRWAFKSIPSNYSNSAHIIKDLRSSDAFKGTSCKSALQKQSHGKMGLN